jgi:RHS repeat-associated protein
MMRVMIYRYGFNGKENDSDVKGEGNSIDFGARMYDSRLGRWLSLDPLAQKYPELSPYQFCDNNPLVFKDDDGRDLIKITVPANNDGTKTKQIVVDKNVAFRVYSLAWEANGLYGYVIGSDFRSKTKQSAMRARWDSGDHTGLRFRPAKVSAHSAGMAVDFSNLPRTIGSKKLKEFNDFAAGLGFKPVEGDVGHYMLDETKNGYKSRQEAIEVNDAFEKQHGVNIP